MALITVSEEPGTETLRVPVLKVFDGDGFLTRVQIPGRGVEFETAVRFGFIDAPELEQPGGHEAREFLTGLISDRWLDLVLLLKMNTGRMIDGYGRIVAVPYLRQEGFPCRNIELEMVLNGWAWVLDRYEPDQRYFEALDDAQLHRRGIWARADNIRPWEFKRQRHRELRGRVRSHERQPGLFEDKVSEHRCPTDGCPGQMVELSGRFGTFYGCSEFPKCRYSSSSPK